MRINWGCCVAAANFPAEFLFWKFYHRIIIKVLHKAVCFASQACCVAPAWAVLTAGRERFGVQAAWDCVSLCAVVFPNESLDLLPLKILVVPLRLLYYSN